jgi:uncharacterized membrane protein (UPF0182 family)
MYATYHMTDPVIFYNKEDQWEIPAIDIDGNSQLMQPYYTVMRLPGEPRAEFIQMLPFTPARKDNLSAWLIARSDGDRYGELEVVRVSRSRKSCMARGKSSRASTRTRSSRRRSRCGTSRDRR